MKQQPQHWSSFLPATPFVVFVVLAAIGLLFYALQWNAMLLLLAMLLLSVACEQSAVLQQPRKDLYLLPKAVTQILDLSHDTEIASIHDQLAEALQRMSQKNDPIFRELATERLDSIVRQAQVLSKASIEYSSTESWRVAYETLLRSPGLYTYHSIAHIESAHYWQDGPGMQSTCLNLELQESRTVSIERIAIIADHLWPKNSQFPMEPIHHWLTEQHRHGIWVRLIRESQLVSESDIVVDLGIYGSRAVGLQIADFAGRTMRFVLDFDFDSVQRAELVWNRLLVYTISYKDLLDQQG